MVGVRCQPVTDLAERVGDSALLTAADIRPSQPDFEVQSVLNPAAARVGDEVILLMRIAERPRTDLDPPADARTLDFAGPHPKIVALPSGHTKADVVAIAMRDPDAAGFRYIPFYLYNYLPGL